MIESDLAQAKARLKEALERAESVHQVVTVDLPHITEVSFFALLAFVLDSLSLAGCFSVFASCFVGLGGDVEPQVSLPLGGAHSGGHDITVAHRARA